MSRRPLRLRLILALDCARDTTDTVLAMIVTVIVIGVTALPRRRRPRPEHDRK